MELVENVPVEHLRQHMSQRWPIDVYFVRRGGELIATAVEDSLP